MSSIILWFIIIEWMSAWCLTPYLKFFSVIWRPRRPWSFVCIVHPCCRTHFNRSFLWYCVTETTQTSNYTSTDHSVFALPLNAGREARKLQLTFFLQSWAWAESGLILDLPVPIFIISAACTIIRNLYQHSGKVKKITGRKQQMTDCKH